MLAGYLCKGHAYVYLVGDFSIPLLWLKEEGLGETKIVLSKVGFCNNSVNVRVARPRKIASTAVTRSIELLLKCMDQHDENFQVLLE